MSRQHVHTRPSRRTRTGLAAAALIAAAGLAAPAGAQTSDWIAGNGSWSSPFNWTPVGVPGPGNLVRIGAVVGVQNDLVTLTGGVSMAGLQISDGMQILNEQWPIIVAGDTLVTGSNFIVDGGTAYSTLRIANSAQAVDFSTQDLNLTESGRVYSYDGPLAVVSGALTIGEGSEWMGNGLVQLTGNGPIALRNDGTIRPAWADLYFNQAGTGGIDLDGEFGDGMLFSSETNDLTVNAAALTDTFSGVVAFHQDSALHMNIAAGWTADSSSEFWSGGNTSPSTAEITGAPLTFAGTMGVHGNDTNHTLSLVASTTVQGTANATVYHGGLLRFDGATTVNGGVFTLEEDGNLTFAGATTVRGGAFTTFSDSSADGSVVFAGPTVWDGAVTLDGSSRQLGAATVSGPTVITAGVFDMDGAPTWDINNSLVVNAASIEAAAGDDFNSTFDIGGGLFGRLTINLDNPSVQWTMAGEMFIAGDLGVFVVRLAGSPVRITGDLTVTGVRSQIDADTVFESGASLHLSSPLTVVRYTGTTRINQGVVVTGSGTIHNSWTGVLTLDTDAAIGQAGVVNDGMLAIAGADAGTASVNRLANSGSGTLRIGVGGAPAADGHDVLMVAGAAQLGGKIEVEIVGDAPHIGDIYSVLSAAGGVTGTFVADPVTDAGATLYEWEVLYGANSVRLRLNRIRRDPCDAADWNDDGTVNSTDISAFLTSWLASVGAPDLTADFNSDGVTNSTDISAFLSAWLAAVGNGCV